MPGICELCGAHVDLDFWAVKPPTKKRYSKTHPACLCIMVRTWHRAACQPSEFVTSTSARNGRQVKRISTGTSTSLLCIYIHVYISEYMCAFMCVYVQICLSHIHVYVHTHTHTHIQMNIHMHIDFHIYIYIHIYIYVHQHFFGICMCYIYIHEHKGSWHVQAKYRLPRHVLTRSIRKRHGLSILS